MANNVTDLGKVGMTPAGSWSASSTYERLDVVTYEGSSYVSLVDSNINFNPSTSTGKWQLMAQHGEFTEQQLEDFKAEVVAESKEEMDSYTDEKKSALDTYEDTKETELNTYATGLKNDFDSNANSKTTDFNQNATEKTTAFNNNASSKTETFDTNASTKTTAFDDNATSKTTAFNTNATNKTTDFNDNATAKTTEFNTNASDKTDDFNDNVTAKTTAFDEHVGEKTDEFDQHTAEMQQEIDELSANMPWDTTEQGTEIQVTDAAKYSKNKLELFGNTSQDSTTGKNMLEINLTLATINGVTFQNKNDGSITLNGTANAVASKKIGSISIQTGKTYILSGSPVNSDESVRIDARPNGVANKLYHDWTSVSGPYTATEDVIVDIHVRVATGYNCDNIVVWPQVEEGSTAHDWEPYTNGASPNPDYPQPIHVVTGNNSVGVTGKNLLNWNLFEGNDYVNVINKTEKILSLTGKTSYYSGECILLNLKPSTQYTIKAIVTAIGTNSLGRIIIHNKNYDGSGRTSSENRIAVSNSTTAPGEVLCTFTTDETGIAYILFQCNSATNNGSITYENIQLEEGAIASSFEPYTHRDYPLNLGSLELGKIGNYQDYIYKENGNWYKYGAIDKYIFSGTETYYLLERTGVNVLQQRSVINNKVNKTRNMINIISSHFVGIKDNDGNIPETIRVDGNGQVDFTITNTNPISVSTDAFKTWLNSHNVTSYYLLATPTTTQITDETLISQLDEIYEHLQLVKGTNNISVTASDLAPYMELTYMQDLPTKLNNLASRIELLEE